MPDSTSSAMILRTCVLLPPAPRCSRRNCLCCLQRARTIAPTVSDSSAVIARGDEGVRTTSCTRSMQSRRRSSQATARWPPSRTRPRCTRSGCSRVGRLARTPTSASTRSQVLQVREAARHKVAVRACKTTAYRRCWRGGHSRRAGSSCSRGRASARATTPLHPRCTPAIAAQRSRAL